MVFVPRLVTCRAPRLFIQGQPLRRPYRSDRCSPTQTEKEEKPPQTEREKIKLFKSTSIIIIINHHEYHDFNDTQTRPLQHLTETIFAYLFIATRPVDFITIGSTILTSPLDLVFRAFSVSDRVIPLSLHSLSVTLPASLPSRLHLSSYQTTPR